MTESRSGRLLGAVLAGGRSRRFGRDKTAVPVGGVPMIRRAVEALAFVADEVVVVSSREKTPHGAWRIVPDLRRDGGPLGGVESALTEARRLGYEGVFVLAADLPLAGPEVVRRVADALTEGDAAAVAVGDASPSASVQGRSRVGSSAKPDFEPLCAVYRTDCLAVVGQLLDEGRRGARNLFQTVGGRRVPVAPEAVLNVNTREAMARVRRRIDVDEAADGEAGS